MEAVPSPWRWPALIAHRGGGLHAPENTLAGLRAGAAMGYRMVEFDVQLSADDVPVLMHDETLDRCSDGTGRVVEHRWAELARLDCGNWHGRAYAGEPMGNLYAAAHHTLRHGVSSNLELKPPSGHEAAQGRHIARIARQLWHGAEDRLLVSSFSVQALQAAREAAPQLHYAWLVDGPVPADWQARADALGCIGIHVDAAHTSRELAADVRGRGYTLAVWTVNDIGQARRFLQWGCHAIFTDALQTLRPLANDTPD